MNTVLRLPLCWLAVLSSLGVPVAAQQPADTLLPVADYRFPTGVRILNYLNEPVRVVFDKLIPKNTPLVGQTVQSRNNASIARGDNTEENLIRPYAVRVLRPLGANQYKELCRSEGPSYYQTTSYAALNFFSPDVNHIDIKPKDGAVCRVSDSVTRLSVANIAPVNDPPVIAIAAEVMRAAGEIADTRTLTVVNTSSGKKEACFYKYDDKLMAIALVCKIVPAGGTVTWSRGARLGFRVKVSEVPAFGFHRPCATKQVDSAVRLNITGSCRVTAIASSPPQRLRKLGVGAGVGPDGLTNYRSWYKVGTSAIQFYVARNAKYLFVAFPGSSKDPKNLELNSTVGVGQIHAGYHHTAVWLDSVLVGVIQQMRGNRTVLITGHSQGAALAGVVAYFISGKGFPVILVTFGAPHYGTARFVQAFASVMGDSIAAYSVEMRGDPMLYAFYSESDEWRRLGTPIDFDLAQAGITDPQYHHHCSYYRVALVRAGTTPDYCPWDPKK